MKRLSSARLIIALFILLASGITPSQAAPNQPNLPDPTTLSWAINLISGTPSVGAHTAIAYDSDHNRPYIAYYDETNGSLMMAHPISSGTGNCGPGNSWRCEVVDHVDGEQKGFYASIDVFPDIDPDPTHSTWKVGVSYYDATSRALKFAETACPTMLCFSWRDTVQYPAGPGSDFAGKHSSLQYSTSGVPMIAYQNYVLNVPFHVYAVRFASYKGDGTGNCGDDNDWECETVDSSGLQSVGAGISMDLNWEGTAFIAYYDGRISGLKYAYFAGFGNCGNGDVWQCNTIDDRAAAEVGFSPSFHAPKFSGDRFRAAYYNKTGGKLVHAYTISGGAGNCGEFNTWQCDDIVDMGADQDQVAISLATDRDANPMIAYSDASGAGPIGLKIAQPAFFMPYANCGGGMLYDWYCSKVDNGGANTDEAAFAGLMIRDSGLAMIAYAETDNYAFPIEHNLKFAYQTASIFLPLAVR